MCRSRRAGGLTWLCDGHWPCCHGSPRATQGWQQPRTRVRTRRNPRKYVGMGCHRQHRGAVGEGCFLGQGKPSPPHSASRSVVAHKSTGKEAWKRLSSFWKLSKATGVRQSRKTKSPDLKYPFVFPPSFSVSAVGEHPKPCSG